MRNPVLTLLDDKGREVYTIEADAIVLDAVRLMNDMRVGSLLILSEGSVAGIFTERDVLTRVVAAGLDPGSTPVADVMTSSLITITPECTVEQAMCIVTEKRCRHLPVVDQGKLLGLISIGDLTRWIIKDFEHEIANLQNYIQGG